MMKPSEILGARPEGRQRATNVLRGRNGAKRQHGCACASCYDRLPLGRNVDTRVRGRAVGMKPDTVDAVHVAGPAPRGECRVGGSEHEDARTGPPG
jgi:hypothetical protein